MKKKRNGIAALLAAVLLLEGTGFPTLAAGSSTLKFASAVTQAFANSDDYTELNNELSMKKVDLAQAVLIANRSLSGEDSEEETDAEETSAEETTVEDGTADETEEETEEEPYLWSPFMEAVPSEGQSLSELYSILIAPLLAQMDVRTAEAALEKARLSVQEEIAGLYADIVTLQQKIELEEEWLAEEKTSLTKIRALLRTGQATQGDVDAQEEAVESREESLDERQEELEEAKTALSEAMGVELSENVSFAELEVESELWEGRLEELTVGTLENSSSYLASYASAQNMLWAFWKEYTARSENYQVPDNILQYMLQAVAGWAIDTEEFQTEYDAYAEARAAGLGQSIEDDDGAYSLYDDVLKYQNLQIDLADLEESLSESVEESYDNLLDRKEQIADLEEEIEALEKKQKTYRVRYRIGELSKDEYDALTGEYEDLEMELLDARSEYFKAYYALDSATGGYLQELVEEIESDPARLVGKETESSYVSSGGLADTDSEGVSDTASATTGSADAEEAEVVYYIKSHSAEEEFSFGVSVPGAYSEEIAYYELWCGELQVGERTATSQEIRHWRLLAWRMSDVEVRFYDADGILLGTCAFDPTEPIGIVTTAPYAEQTSTTGT
ncbi:MAG: TolC family protein [Lachnospiraceae bacterium]|nr:TolC family protein [Lachnospiraceae bacterium]